MFDTNITARSAIVLAVHLPSVRDDGFARSLEELDQLARTLGVAILGTLTQKRESFDAGAYLGKGKREELKLLVESTGANTLLIEHELTPSQAHNLQEETGCEVLDRTQV